MMPELVHVGPIVIYTYGFMWMVGIWLAVWRAMRVAPRYGIDPDYAFLIAFWSVGLGIVGGRIGFVVMNWSYYAHDFWGIFRVWEGGMSYFWGFALALVAAIVVIRKHRLPLWRVGDLAAPSLALGYAIARIGCFGAGCCYGKPTDLPWGVLFPGLTQPVHPTQLYATLMNLIIFALLLRWAKHQRFEGELFAGFLTLHGLYRFINEFFRAGATSRIAFDGITLGHFVSVAVMAAGAALYYFLRAWGVAAKVVSRQPSRLPSGK